MNDDMNKAEESKTQDVGLNLVGDSGATGGNGSELERLRHELQSARVETGRVSALQKRNNDLQAEVEKLRSENESLSRQNRDYMGMLPEDMRNQVDAEQLQASGVLMDKMLREREQQSEMRRKQEMEQFHQSRVNDFIHRIDAAYPTFRASICPGGPNEPAWMNFQKIYGPSLMSAYNSFDVDAFSQLINLFYSSALGVQQRGAASTPTPSPTNVGTGAGSIGGGQHYTFDQYESTIGKANEDHLAGKIDARQYQAILSEMAKAVEEGRVTPPSE